MNQWWDQWAELGEMFGSLILTFGVLSVILVAKQESLGLNTNLKRRLFMGLSVPCVVIIGLIAAKGFGGHGQINPAITLMVGAIKGHFQEAPAIIGFQLIGAIGAALLFLACAAFVGQWSKLNTMFKFNNQGVIKTTGMEFFGNMFWLIPISAFVVALLKGDINFYELAITAAIGKIVLVGAFEEFGAANFNAQIWFGKMIVTAVSQKGKITLKEFSSEMSGLVMTMAIGIAFGYVAQPFFNR